MTDTERVEQATRSFLDDHPDQEDTLAALLEHEQRHDSWAFDDAPVDSGQFGELVSRSFVEKTDGGDYRFADRASVEAILDGEEPDPETADSSTAAFSFDVSVPAVDTRTFAALLGALAVVIAARSLFFRSVFREGYVVSPANDPYFYRYWQAELLEHSGGPTDLGMLATVGELTRIRPLSHALNWWFADLFGSASLVAAFQPIVASVLLALAIYGLAQTLTADHRIAVGSVLLFALTPVLVVYTGLGFLEHRPYQYLWVGVMAFSLGWLGMDLTRRHRDSQSNPALAHARDPRAWAVAAVLAIAVGAMAHTWGGSPLSFLPVAAYFAFRVVQDCRERLNPLLANGPALAGVTAGSFLALAIHLRWGWHESIAATVPVVVALGAIAVAVLATGWLRFDLQPAGLLAAEGVIAAVGAGLFWRLRPEDVARLQERSDALFGRETALETSSLFTTEQAIIFGPLSQIGIGFYLALIPLGYATYYVSREYDPAWLAAVCFTWFYLVLAAIQVRFAAQFSIFCAVFGSVGLVYLLGAVDLARPPTLFDRDALDGPSIKLPETRTVGIYLVAVIAVVLLLNLIFVPSLLAQTQYSDEQFEAALLIDDHAEEIDRDHPQNFVLSEWGDNRMYNYFVSGESSGYGYAQSNHVPFISDTDPDSYFGQFDGRVGYVVLTDVEAPERTVQAQLFDEFGAGNESVAHYQLLYAEGEVRAFVVVDGAVVQTNAEPGENVTASTDVETAGKQFSYERTATADEEGTVALQVAYPGAYDIEGETVTVTADDVYEGESVTVDTGESSDE